MELKPHKSQRWPGATATPQRPACDSRVTGTLAHSARKLKVARTDQRFLMQWVSDCLREVSTTARDCCFYFSLGLPGLPGLPGLSPPSHNFNSAMSPLFTSTSTPLRHPDLPPPDGSR